ncbi:hypothetical protein EDD11_006690 [Mortierella claussenii]|nr:hypothetical protein EDD11_006690 [Mortierella claussenii]
MTKTELETAAKSRRSNRAVSSAPTSVTKPPKTATGAVAATNSTVVKKTLAEDASTTEPIVKRGPGRPRGSTNKNKAEKATVAAVTAANTPARRGRKPKAATLSAVNDTTTGLKEEITDLDTRSRKRKLDAGEEENSGTWASPKKVATTDIKSDGPKKRGRPPGSGNKNKPAVAAPASRASVPMVATTKTKGEPKSEPSNPAPPKAIAHKTGTSKPTSVPTAAHDDDTEGAFSGIKLTIERCTTCTQYHKNVVRIFKITKDMYPNALLHEEVVPNSKSFEIYLSVDGSKNKLIWSGKAHAPPKRLAFPDSDVFVGLLKNELKEE